MLLSARKIHLEAPQKRKSAVLLKSRNTALDHIVYAEGCLLEFKHLLQDFTFLTATDNIFAICKHDFESIAKPDDDFLHVF